MTSPLYCACRDGDLRTVKQLLPKLSVDEINRIEPNGSTAVDVANHCGHHEIVEILLKKGAMASQKIHFGTVPCDEASSNETKELFSRNFTTDTMNGQKFVAEAVALEWTKVGHAEIETARFNYRYYMKAEPKIASIVELILNDVEIRNADWMLNIRPYFLKAAQDNDPIQLVKAYTAEEGQFYSRLNRKLAEDSLHWASETPKSTWHRLFTAQVAKDPRLNKIDSWRGKCYRSMWILQEELDAYVVNTVVINKGFLSTSRLRFVAEKFMRTRRKRALEEGKLPVLCTYNVKWPQKAMYVGDHSVIAGEEEVLIVPHRTAFRVQRIHIPDNLPESPIEIELKRYFHSALF